MEEGDELRVESDLLGRMELPAAALMGINTLRSVENFPVSGRTLGSRRSLVEAFAETKNAAARANTDCGILEPSLSTVIVAAAEEMKRGDFDAHLVCDLLEGSGGTSANMNVNEVLANVALCKLGEAPGHYASLHPNDHINLSQSTNDVVPTAVRIAILREAEPTIEALKILAAKLAGKAAAFEDVLRLGRTCMQDAQPMTLGQALSGYAAVILRHATMIGAMREPLLVVPLGSTAVGTGFGAPRDFATRAIQHLRAISGLAVRTPDNPFDALQNADEFARLSAELRASANSLWKIANDLIILSSGPAGGIGEIRLKEVQAGSSIMPGKVNPVLAMSLCQVALAVNGNDLAVSLAAQQGLLDLNHYELLIADRLLDSLSMIAGSVRVFAERCIGTLEPDEERSWGNLVNSSALATSLVPRLGYSSVSALVREALAAGQSFHDFVVDQGVVPQADLEQILRDAAKGRTLEFKPPTGDADEPSLQETDKQEMGR